MADTRDILLRLLGRETVSPAAKKAGDSLEDLGDDARDAGRAARKLDGEIDDLKRSLVELAAAYAITKDDSFAKQMRQQERDLRRLTRTRNLLPDPEPEGRSWGKRLSRGITDGLASIGTLGGRVFTGLPPQAQAAIGGSVVAAVAGAGPLIGAAVSNAVVAGVGSGAVAVGIVAAFQDPRVKGAGQDLAHDLKVEFAGIGADFAGDTVAAIRNIRREVERLGLREALEPATDLIRPLTEGLLGLVRNVMPGLRSAIASAEKPIQAVAGGLEDLGSALGDMLTTMSEHSESSAKALTMLFDIIEYGVRTVTLTVDALATAFEWFDKIPSWLTSLTGLWMEFTGSGAESTEEWDTSLEGLRAALDDTGDAATEAAGDIQTYDEMLREMTGSTLDARGAQRDLEAAIDDARKALKDNGKTLDINTAKGRENQSALDGIARAANRTYDAVLKQTGSTAAAIKAAQRGRDAFIALATKLLGSAAAAKALADKLFAIPSKKTVNIRVHTEYTARGTPTQRLPFSEGGVVEGQGPKGVDSVPAVLAPGEGVLTVEGLRRLGGEKALEAINRGVGGMAMPAQATPRRGGIIAPILRVDPRGFSGMERMFLGWFSEAVRAQWGTEAAQRLQGA